MDDKKQYSTKSFLEIAEEVMKKKKKPQTLDKITEEVFKLKDMDTSDSKLVAQFELDFMLSGEFIYCGEDEKKHEQLWDFKFRQPSSLLDKDGGYLEDPYENDEDVINNELKDDIDYDDKSIRMDDDEEPENEEDDIQEELGLIDEDSETSEVTNTQYNNEDEEEENDDVEDLSDEFEK